VSSVHSNIAEVLEHLHYIQKPGRDQGDDAKANYDQHEISRTPWAPEAGVAYVHKIQMAGGLARLRDGAGNLSIRRC
jgi:hypothetical protein